MDDKYTELGVSQGIVYPWVHIDEETLQDRRPVSR